MIKLQIVHPESQVAEITCPFCLDPLEVGQAVVVCPKCETIHHVLCWQENNDTCAAYQGCSGVGEIDWIAPLHVNLPEEVHVTSISEPISDMIAANLGLQVVNPGELSLLRILTSDITPTYIIALHQFVFVTGLVNISHGKVLQNKFIYWQYKLLNQAWLWLLAWAILILVVSSLNVLRRKPRWQTLGTGLSLLIGLGLWFLIAPLVVEVFFIPQYLWPGSVGKLFLYFGWGRILLAIAMSISIFYILMLAVIRLNSIPNAILLGLFAILLDFGKLLFGLIGLILIAWAGIFVGVSFLGRILHQNWIIPILLNNGLTIATNGSFILLIMLFIYASLVSIAQKAVKDKQQQKELINA